MMYLNQTAKVKRSQILNQIGHLSHARKIVVSGKGAF